MLVAIRIEQRELGLHRRLEENDPSIWLRCLDTQTGGCNESINECVLLEWSKVVLEPTQDRQVRVMKTYQREAARCPRQSCPHLEEREKRIRAARSRCSTIRPIPWLRRPREDVQNAAASHAKVE